MNKGDRIKLVRIRKGLSQIELANKIGISKQNLYKYENSIITNIPSDKIEAIARVCDTTPAYIMGWEGLSNQKTSEMRPAFTLSQEEKELIIAFREFPADYKLKVTKLIEDIKAEIEKDKKLEMLIKQNEELMYGRAVAYGGETANVVLTPEASAKIDEYIRQEEEREDNDLL